LASESTRDPGVSGPAEDGVAPIPVPGTFNFRDAGGYPASGGVVRTGKLFRSDGLHSLGADGRATLVELGIETVIDLRDDFEVKAMPDDIAGLNLDVVRLPVFEGSGASQGVIGKSLVDLYQLIVTEHADTLVAALRAIAHSGDTPVLVHCTAGKDRTGIVIALALLAVGVDRDTVIADYARSEANLSGEWLDRMIAEISSHGVPETPALRGLLSGSPPEALCATIDLLEQAHGTVRKYLLDSGISMDDLALLQSTLVHSQT
jgi:protein-tyrosine phosphatase